MSAVILRTFLPASAMKPEVPFAESEVVPGTPYRVIRLVGKGGMGSVYEVEHQELGKRFVLKSLLVELADRADLVERLRLEWRALGKLEHENIVSVSDAGVSSSGVPFFVMERLVGETVSEALQRERQLPVREALRIAQGVLSGLAAAHEIGLVHRDVKPANVFLTKRGGVKLLDFGIAKVLDRDFSVTSIGNYLGTPRYMSPEQIYGETIDGQADLYSVGLLLFEMLAGQSPFHAEKMEQWLYCHLHKTPPRCSEIARKPISPDVDMLVAQLLEKQPARRPANAGTAALRIGDLMTAAGAVSRDTRPSARSRVARDGTLLTLPETPSSNAERRRAPSERATIRGPGSSIRTAKDELGEAGTVPDSLPIELTPGSAIQSPTRTAAIAIGSRPSSGFETPPPVAPSGRVGNSRLTSSWVLVGSGAALLLVLFSLAGRSPTPSSAKDPENPTQRALAESPSAASSFQVHVAAARPAAVGLPAALAAPVPPTTAKPAAAARVPAARTASTPSPNAKVAPTSRTDGHGSPVARRPAAPRKKPVLPGAGLDGVVLAPRALPSSGL